MASFSERLGLTAPKEVQANDMDGQLRNSLWDCVYCHYQEVVQARGGSGYRDAWKRHVWQRFFGHTMDTLPDYDQVDGKDYFLLTIRRWFFDKVTPWNKVYDFIEFTATLQWDSESADDFENMVNNALVRNLAGYRLIGTKIAPFTNDIEIAEINKAIMPATEALKPVTVHIRDALAFLSDKTAPNYRNSMSESISAVEAATKLIGGFTGKATLHNGVEKVTADLNLNKDVRDGFIKLYAYTNDTHGIRHSLKDMDLPEQEDAVYFLVSCSAFVNYIIEKARKLGKLPT